MIDNLNCGKGFGVGLLIALPMLGCHNDDRPLAARVAALETRIAAMERARAGVELPDVPTDTGSPSLPTYVRQQTRGRLA